MPNWLNALRCKQNVSDAIVLPIWETDKREMDSFYFDDLLFPRFVPDGYVMDLILNQIDRLLVSVVIEELGQY